MLSVTLLLQRQCHCLSLSSGSASLGFALGQFMLDIQALLYMGVKTNESTPQKQKPCLYHSVLRNILYTIKFTHFKL